MGTDIISMIQMVSRLWINWGWISLLFWFTHKVSEPVTEYDVTLTLTKSCIVVSVFWPSKRRKELASSYFKRSKTIKSLSFQLLSFVCYRDSLQLYNIMLHIITKIRLPLQNTLPSLYKHSQEWNLIKPYELIQIQLSLLQRKRGFCKSYGLYNT